MLHDIWPNVTKHEIKLQLSKKNPNPKYKLNKNNGILGWESFAVKNKRNSYTYRNKQHRSNIQKGSFSFFPLLVHLC